MNDSDLATGSAAPPSASALHRLSDAETEVGILGAMMMTPGSIAEVRRVLRPADFYLPAHEIICRAIYDMYDEQHPVDPLAVRTYLSERGLTRQAKGGDYLLDLIANALHGGWDFHARKIKDEAVRRAASMALSRAMQLLHMREDSETVPPQEVLAQARDLIEEALTEAATTSANLPTFLDALTDRLEWLEERSKSGATMLGIPTGLRDLDNVLMGLAPGSVTVVAGRPAHGKSTLGLNIAAHAARSSYGVHYVTQEMGQGEVVDRILAHSGQVEFTRLRSPASLQDNDWNKIGNTISHLAGINLHIDDQSNTIEQVQSAALANVERWRNTGAPLGLLVIDYLQLLTSGRGGRESNRNNEIDAMTRSLKVFAQRQGLAVVLISSLKRGPSEAAPPTMSELRDSGAIEYHATNIIMVHRPEVVEPEGPRAGEIDLDVVKVRNGQARTVVAIWRGRYQTISDAGPREPERF